jgi:uncharacterized membrane protein
VTVAYLLATKITANSGKLSIQIWRIITVTIVSLGVLSCAVSIQTETWNGKEDFTIESSRLINGAIAPVIIADGDLVYSLMPLNYRLEPHVRLIWASQSTKIQIPNGFSDVFLFSVSPKLLSYLQAQPGLKIEPVYRHSYSNIFLWKSSSPSTLWKIAK